MHYCQMSFLCLFSKQTGQDILHLPAKEVFQGQLNSKSSMDPWYTEIVKTSKGFLVQQNNALACFSASH